MSETGWSLGRPSDRCDHHWPICRIDDQGTVRRFGQLSRLPGDGTRLIGVLANWLRDDFVAGVFPGVPWFLEDQKPHGFLGRQFARGRGRDSALPGDITLWDDDAVFAYLLRHGDRGVGDFVFGGHSLEGGTPSYWGIVQEVDRADRYAELIDQVLGESLECPQVGGEQPKFTTAVVDDNGATRHVIVKFSEPVEDNVTAQRWADLLICEHLASEVLAEYGNPSARTELVWSQGRLCLEATRFDRIGAYGRRGCVTLAAWSDAHDGNRDDWASAAARMRAARWIEDDALNVIRQRWWFGRLISNCDMHFGNLCFFLDDSLPLQVTPSYDMLPMLYRPAGNGAVVPRDFRVAVPLPADLSIWRQVAGWAEDYWQRVSVEALVSDGFRRLGEANRSALAAARDRYDPDPDPDRERERANGR